MKITKKEYKLNKDFTIVCITKVSNKGVKSYSILVEQTSLPFINTLEEHKGMTNPNEANTLFKKIIEKYKEGI